MSTYACICITERVYLSAAHLNTSRSEEICFPSLGGCLEIAHSHTVCHTSTESVAVAASRASHTHTHGVCLTD